MYLTGHVTIVEEVLSEGSEYFINSLQKKYPDFSQERLMFGLKYVDTPCGKYSIRDGRVYFTKRKLCNITELARLLHEKRFGESKLFQFHKGFFAHLHSMTTDPDNTVQKIRNKIIMSLLGYCLLGLYDDNLFDGKPALNPNSMWIGMALHVITDSYSPAHTIRSPYASYSVRPRPQQQANADFRARINVHERIKALAKGKTVEYATRAALMANLMSQLESPAEQKFAESRQKDLWRIYKVLEFEYETNVRVKGMIKGKHLEKLPGYKGPETVGDIVTFQYYADQSTLMHQRLDLLHYAKKDKALYRRMKDECSDFLKLYKDAVETGDASTFLHLALEFFRNRTFRIHQKYMQEKTNKVYKP